MIIKTAGKRLSLKKNFSWNLFGNVLYNFFQWAILATLNKHGGTGAVGLFVLGLAFASPITEFCSLQLRGIFISDVEEEYSFGDYLGVRILWNVVSVILCSICALFYYPDYESMIAIILMGIAVNVQSSGEIYASYFQKQERLDVAAISLIFKGILNFVGTFVVYMLTHNVCLVILWLAISRWLIVFFFDRNKTIALMREAKGEDIVETRLHIKPVFSCKVWKAISWLGLPMGLNMAFFTFATQIPRFVISKYHDLSLLGIFGSISYVLVAGNMVMRAVLMTLMSRFAVYYHSKNAAKLKELVTYAFVTGALIGGVALILVYFFGDWLLELLYTNEYRGYKNVLLLLTANMIVSSFSNIIGTLMTSARYFKIQPLLSLIKVLLTLIACFVWIPRYAVLGAALAIVIPQTAVLILKFGVMCHIFHTLKISNDNRNV